MAIKQTIEFNSNNTYFAGFLQEIINKSEIEGSVIQKDKKIEMVLENKNVDRLNKFLSLSQKYLPHSIFLGNIQTKVEDVSVNKTAFKSKTYNISPCKRCLDEILDPSNEHYLDDEYLCTHYCNEPKTYQDNTIFSPHYSEKSAVLITDASKINELFILTEDETKALFSIEKPTLKATIKDETLKEITGKKFINIKASYNLRSILAALNAKESGIDYLFFNNNDDLKITIVKKNISIIKAKRVASKLQNLHKDMVLNRFLNIKKEAGFKKTTGANLSRTNGICFMVADETDAKKVINFQKFNLKEILENMQNDENRKKLIKNFKEKFSHIIEELQENPHYDLFETLSALLELKERGFEELSDKALEFRGNGGLKIDTLFKEGGFDYTSFLGSVMSFKLADCEEKFLAYSIFEAFGDMSMDILNQLKRKFEINNVIMMGNMFENSVLYSRILSKYQLANPYFGKSFALDD